MKSTGDSALRRPWRAVRTAGVCVAALTLQAAYADSSLMCGNSLVSVGMVAAQVVAKCGEPKDKVATEEPVRVRNANGTVVVAGTRYLQQWTYDRGYGRFPALLKFEDGKLKSIDLLTRP
jgi:hypothetical protein